MVATTEDGRKVILNKDGTWQYVVVPDSTQNKTNKNPNISNTPQGVAVLNDFRCEDIIRTRMNVQTQQDNLALSEPLIISEEGDEKEFSMLLGVNSSRTYTWDLTISRTKGCATETPMVVLTFVDNSSIRLPVKNDFVCDKKISMFLSKGLGNKGDLKALRTKPIRSIDVETRSGHIVEDLSLEQGVMLQKAFICLGGK